jgi:hypothetical protein
VEKKTIMLEELLVQDIYDYLKKRPFEEVCMLMSRLNVPIQQYLIAQREANKDADNTGS